MVTVSKDLGSQATVTKEKSPVVLKTFKIEELDYY
jgi:hypothetical protein